MPSALKGRWRCFCVAKSIITDDISIYHPYLHGDVLAGGGEYFL